MPDTAQHMETLRKNLAAVRRRIAAAERAAGRPEGSVDLLPVTKFHPAEHVALLTELGITDVAENREQEARAKAEAVPALRFHMIGQIQSKKANSVARWAGAVHSLDSLKLAAGLERGMELALERGERGEDDAVLPVYLQVSVDGDGARGGVPVDQLDALADAVVASEHLELLGLMVVPPLGEDPAPVFERTRIMADETGKRIGRPLRLSAGMSGDLEAAVAAGSDVVRVGTDVMGRRPLA